MTRKGRRMTVTLRTIVVSIREMMWNFLKEAFVYDGLGKRSYSQSGEDMILRQLFDDKKKGFYVDVGAYHPKVFSNTYYFYKKGWRGINIEPNRKGWEALERVRVRDINLNLGVGKEKKMGICDDGARSKLVKGDGVKVKTLEGILDEYLPKGVEIDFLSVDTEGMDEEVLESNNWNKYFPDVVLVESEGGRKLLERKGYVLVGLTGLTKIYKK